MAADIEVAVVTGSNLRIAARASVLTVGRSPDSDVVLSDQRVSRRHVRLRRTTSGIEITDLGSRNGLSAVVDGVPRWIRPAMTTTVAAAEFQLRLGSTTLTVRALVDRAGEAERWGRSTGSTFALERTPLMIMGIAVGALVALVVLAGILGQLETPPEATGVALDETPGTSVLPPARVCSLEQSSGLVVDATVKVITASGTGTAFHLGNGVFVTAAHVVSGASAIRLESELFQRIASLTLIDAEADLAVLTSSLSFTELPALEWSSRSEVKPGLTVVTVGYPLGGVGEGAAAGSLTRGVVSSVFSIEGQVFIQIDVPVNPGNSGGALVDECGDIVGVVVAKVSEEGIEGLAFAVEGHSAKERLGLR